MPTAPSPDRRAQRWLDLGYTPQEVAKQLSWERRNRVYQALRSGGRQREIALRLGIHPARVSQLVLQVELDAKYGKLPPIVRDLTGGPFTVREQGEIRGMIRAHGRRERAERARALPDDRPKTDEEIRRRRPKRWAEIQERREWLPAWRKLNENR